MTLHRIEHAIVMDTDDVPGRGGYEVVGISPRVSPADRSFIASNFGISDYLHDPKTENRLFYSVFRMPSGRHAFVRRFARPNELRRNNTQRRLVVHTLLLEDEVWRELNALPWLLLNARVRYEGSENWDRLRPDVPWVDDGSVLPALEWDSDDGSTTNIWSTIIKRVELIGSQFGGGPREAHDLLARVITAVGTKGRAALPQDAAYDWVTMLAWSMLPRHDRDELAWTQHDSMNISGVTFSLVNVPGGDFDPATVRPAEYGVELVKMNVASEDSWLDFNERTSRDPLTVRRPKDLQAWVNWRGALLNLRAKLSEGADVATEMKNLAGTVEANPDATWIDGEEVLRLIWGNVSDAIGRKQSADQVVMTWSRLLRSSGLSDSIFRAAPSKRWLTRASADVGPDPLVWFFLSGGGEDQASRPTRTVLAEWLIETKLNGVDGKRVATLAYLLSVDDSPALQPLLELLLDKQQGLTALTDYLRRRDQGSVEIIYTAAPLVLRYAHPNALEFFRDIFIPRFDRRRVDAALAREIAEGVSAHPPTYINLLRRVSPNVAATLMTDLRQSVADHTTLAREVLLHFSQQEGGLENAGPLAIALAQAGEPATVWFDVLLRIARSTDAQSDAGAARDFVAMLSALRAKQPNLTGAMDRLIALLKEERLYGHDAVRAMIMLLRPVWSTGGRAFVDALIGLMDRARLITTWEDVVAAYVADFSQTRRTEVSDLAAAFWCKVDSSQVEMLAPKTGALLDRIHGDGLRKLSNHWAKKVGSLPRSSPVVEKLLSLVQNNSSSYEVERDLASRDIRLGVSTPLTLNRAEAALARLHGIKGTRLFIDEVHAYLGNDGPAARAVRLLNLFASDEIHPTVRLALQMHVLPEVLKSLKRRHWNDVREATDEQDLLGLGAVSRLAYAVGASASGRTAAHFERVWTANDRQDALDALYAGRLTRSPRQWLARMTGTAAPSMLAQ